MNQEPQMRMEREILDAIEKQVAEAKNRIIKEATEDFSFEISKIIGEVSVTLANYYSVERQGTDLIIHVHIGEKTS